MKARASSSCPSARSSRCRAAFSVAVVSVDHKVAIKPVQLGAEVDGTRIVEAGLVGGEQVVVDGLQHISDGAVVEPHAAQPPTKN